MFLQLLRPPVTSRDTTVFDMDIVQVLVDIKKTYYLPGQKDLEMKSAGEFS